MQKRVTGILLECLLDLGITVVYATLAGLLIVAVVTSDNGPISPISALAYAVLLPGAVAALVAVEALIRVVADWRANRPTAGRTPARSNPARVCRGIR